MPTYPVISPLSHDRRDYWPGDTVRLTVEQAERLPPGVVGTRLHPAALPAAEAAPHIPPGTDPDTAAVSAVPGEVPLYPGVQAPAPGAPHTPDLRPANPAHPAGAGNGAGPLKTESAPPAPPAEPARPARRGAARPVADPGAP